MDPDEQKREENIRHLKSVIDASAKLNVNMVTTFIGRDQTKSVEENLKLVEKNLAAYSGVCERTKGEDRH